MENTKLGGRIVCCLLSVLLMFSGCAARSKSAEDDFPAFECNHTIKHVASAELVSQEKPLTFFPLLEDPAIEGIQVKLTYADGSAEVVDAYEFEHDTVFEGADILGDDASGDAGTSHWRGMCISLGNSGKLSLKPGLNKVALFCFDLKYDWEADGTDYSPQFDSLHPDKVRIVDFEESGYAYCMVDVYVQTLEEYAAEHGVQYTTLTEDMGEKQFSAGRDNILQVTASDSGVYAIEMNGHFADRIYETGYLGDGVLNTTPYYPDETDKTKAIYYAKLNANEPICFLLYGHATIALKRMPEVFIAPGETITVTEPVSLRIKDFDSEKAGMALDGTDTSHIDGYYTFERKLEQLM